MKSFGAYVVAYAVGYLFLMALDYIFFGGGHWLYAAMLLLFGEMFRLFTTFACPGFADRMARKYGPSGSRLAEKIKGEWRGIGR